ncbi:hypothetical protein NVP1031O_116 [Vibrio phage 1.031.O._10N.261.46.F8]|nr:hypothetical protein NVP1031O_116 [Vibrio phage 1.031.O._10N.261.46.F8]
MNIFALSECPIQSAAYSADKHVVKMQLETVQLLSTALRHVRGVDTAVTMPDGSVDYINLLEGEEYRIVVRTKIVGYRKNGTISRWSSETEVGRDIQDYLNCLPDIDIYESFEYNFWKYQAKYVEETKIALASTHFNHPSNIWTRSGAAQYNWLMIHAYALEAEWKSRYSHSADRRHKSVQLLDNFPSGEDLFEVTEFTLPTPAMPDHYKVYDASGSIDVVQSYRTYYLYDKSEMGLPLKLWRPIRKGIVDAYVVSIAA